MAEDAERWARQLVWIDTPKKVEEYVASDMEMALDSRQHQRRTHRGILKRLRRALAAVGVHPGMEYGQMQAALSKSHVGQAAGSDSLGHSEPG